MKGTLATLLVLVIAVSLFASGCISSNEQDQTPTQSNSNPEKSLVTIRTTGATFPQYQVQKWIEAYMKTNPNVKIEYEGGGSGHGQDAFLKGITHIGRTDPPVKESTWKKFLETGDQPLQFPWIVGAVVIAYNVPGVDELKLDGETLAKIFMGEIEYWDDPAIKSLNPNVQLPNKKIIVIHRSDSSGTTAVFTTYLTLVSKEWAEKVGAGKTVDWPVDKLGRGIGGKGNPGVVQALKSTEYSIAYTELSFAIEENLKVVALKNKAGNFVKPTDETIKAAVAAVKSFIPDPTEGYKEDPAQLMNAPGENAYPIIAFTHALVWQNKGGKHYTKEEAEAIKDFLRWVLTEGQKPENIAPGYVGLPPEVAQIGLKAVEMIQTG
ncbi:phosphate ABC transporter substrate-binding protein PstS [Thermococcus sp. 101 C5]|uniref:phosphate ABC transporter substrate-binding protein PstS n=1 Tax=Thermococcus sp. 101 C5 TaxID=2654197 RepID=UPI00128AE6B7|nr:phosphate ABC transporter substrate-binding protein PstS [Thermococcus sp. 101 C5]MPW38784.1 phosphate ABC transporter substrate-binding protein PstS [Thermococcus sp. 101 C5]